MTAALVIILVYGTNVAGGWDTVVANAKEIPRLPELHREHQHICFRSGKYTPFMIASTLAWGLGYFGMPPYPYPLHGR